MIVHSTSVEKFPPKRGDQYHYTGQPRAHRSPTRAAHASDRPPARTNRPAAVLWADPEPAALNAHVLAAHCLHTLTKPAHAALGRPLHQHRREHAGCTRTAKSPSARPFASSASAGRPASPARAACARRWRRTHDRTLRSHGISLTSGFVTSLLGIAHSVHLPITRIEWGGTDNVRADRRSPR